MQKKKSSFLKIASVGVIAFLVGLLTAVSLRLPPFSAGAVDAITPGDPRILSQAFVKVAKEVGPSVVSVDIVMEIDQAESDIPFEFFDFPFGPPAPEQPRSPFGEKPNYKVPKRKYDGPAGCGVIISTDGYVLTNNHVVEKADVVKVRLQDKRQFKAKIVGTDPLSDIALLKIDAQDLPAARLGDSDKLEVGEWVLAVGNPFGFEHSVTAGIVSAKGRSARIERSSYQDFIQTDAAINKGNSGGALINLDGEVIGINTAIVTSSSMFGDMQGNQGVGFAIPINMAKNIMDQLIKKGTVERAWLGVYIDDLDADMAKKLGLGSSDGSLVVQVTGDSPAGKAGVKLYDVIVSVDGQPMPDPVTLRNHIASNPVGKVVTLGIMRDGSKIDIKVTLGKLPTEAGKISFKEEKGGESDLTESEWGFSVTRVEPGQGGQYGLSQDISGLVVIVVQPGSPSQAAGLRKGDVIINVDKQGVSSASDLKAKMQGKESVFLTVISEGATRAIWMKK